MDENSNKNPAVKGRIPDSEIPKTNVEWRKRLTPEQFEIARRKGTERAFSGTYWNTKTPGTYRCICCGESLFRSGEKFESGHSAADILQDMLQTSLAAKPYNYQTLEDVCS